MKFPDSAQRAASPLAQVQDLSYVLRWRVRGVYPGAHRGVGSGSLGVLRGLLPFHRSPDARRLDLRQSMRDPFRQWYVRDYQPRTAATLYVLVDVSASMAVGQANGKLKLAAELCALLARSAHRNGDAFGLYACGTHIHRDISFASRRSGLYAPDIAERLASLSPTDHNMHALLNAADELAGTRKLIFLVSDFMFPDADVRRILERLAQHDVVPVLLDEQSLDKLPRWGLAQLQDAETGQSRLAFLRPSTQARWQEQAAARAARQDALCLKLANRPFRMGRTLDGMALNHYLSVR